MIIRPMSDLHLEFDQANHYSLFTPPVLPGEKESVLVLAGDIGVAAASETFVPFLREVSRRFRATVLTIGNHEHYNGSIVNTHHAIRRQIEQGGWDNVHLLEDQAFIMDDTAFVGATLWTDFSNRDPEVMRQAEHSVHDYHLIRSGSDRSVRKLTARDTLTMHENSRDFIFDTVRKCAAGGYKTAIVTHHAPTYRHIQDFIRDDLRGAYASELESEILATRPDLWIHGHTHASFDYSIGETRIVCNPRGYFPHSVNQRFNPACLIRL